MVKFQNLIIKSSVGFTAVKTSFDAKMRINQSKIPGSIQKNMNLNPVSSKKPRPLVILLHGFTGSMTSWDKTRREIYARNHYKDCDFIMFDFYGSGKSSFLPPHIPYSTSVFEQQLNDLIAVLYLGASFDHTTFNTITDTTDTTTATPISKSTDLDISKNAKYNHTLTHYLDGEKNNQSLIPHPPTPYRPNFSNLSRQERKKIPDIMLVGHSQGGILAAHYGNNPLHDWIKSILLVTPVGINFKIRDILHTPWHIFPRTLYTMGSAKWTRKMAIVSSYGLLNLAPFLMKKVSSSLYFKETIDYLHGFDIVKLKGQELKQYLNMISSMLDHSDLLKDRKETYQKLGSRNIPLTLIFGNHDSIVPLSAGRRLKQILLQTCGQEKEVQEVVMDASHALPSERPRELVNVIMNAAGRHFGMKESS